MATSDASNSYTVQVPQWLTSGEIVRRFDEMHPILQCLAGQLFDRETIARFAEMDPDASWMMDVKLTFDKGRAVLRPTITQH